MPGWIEGPPATVEQTFRDPLFPGGLRVSAPWHCFIKFHHPHPTKLLGLTELTSVSVALSGATWASTAPCAAVHEGGVSTINISASSPAYQTLRTLLSCGLYFVPFPFGSPGLCRWGVPGPSTASSHPVVRGPAWFIRKYSTTILGLRAFAAGGSLGPPRRHRIQWPGPSFTTILGLRAFAAGGSPGPPRRIRIQWLGSRGVYKDVLDSSGSPDPCRWGVPGPSTASSHPVASPASSPTYLTLHILFAPGGFINSQKISGSSSLGGLRAFLDNTSHPILRTQWPDVRIVYIRVLVWLAESPCGSLCSSPRVARSAPVR